MFRNPETGKKTSVPRHPNIDEYLAFDICKQLGIPKPKINYPNLQLPLVFFLKNLKNKAQFSKKPAYFIAYVER